MIPSLLAEDHCDAYWFWKELGLVGGTCVHVDAHLDVADFTFEAVASPNPYIPRGGLDCGNFLGLALRDGVVEHLIWVLPPFLEGTLDWARNELQACLDLSVEEYEALHEEDGRVEGTLYGCRFTLCRANRLPALRDPVMLDVDVDYLVDWEERAWQTPVQLSRDLGRLQPAALSVAFSSRGGYTPPELRYLGPEIMRIQGGFLRQDPGYRWSPLDRGSALYRRGQVEAALEELAREPGDASLYLRGMVHYREGSPEDALSLWAPLGPRLAAGQQAWIGYLRAAARMRLLQFEEAIAELTVAVRRHPHPDYLHLLGLACTGAGDPAVGARWMRMALQRAPDRLANAHIYADLGIATGVPLEEVHRRVPP